MIRAMDGILNLNKPPGITSFAAVARVKRITHEKHCGHAGTLDPLATGVLPICLGQATRVIEYLHDQTKDYRAEVEFGVTTDTDDVEGQAITVRDASGVSRAGIESALANFRGAIQQVPPIYSAIKQDGKRQYELARAGLAVERKERSVRIDRLEIVEWQPPVVTLDIVCGKGTYIRSIARDLGELLGCGAHMKSLVRLRVGVFTLADALTLEQLEAAFQRGRGSQCLSPLDCALVSFEAVVVSPEQQRSLVCGASIEGGALGENCSPLNGSRSLCRAYAADGRFIGMLRYDLETGRWRPDKIFLTERCAGTGEGT